MWVVEQGTDPYWLFHLAHLVKDGVTKAEAYDLCARIGQTNVLMQPVMETARQGKFF
jgi:hypothetical protein